ncbi:hypothetical protein CSA37_00115 [Candidatus Fermentibacteria bacterium]|nr:MAG: hypothetical protein CSA37_00115 [Candidatus Fermentibacteria bacterium]
MAKFIIPAIILLMVSAAEAEWSENFDSYAAGSGISGQGGWFPWDNNPSADAYVSTDQARSGANSIDITPTSDVVQEFDITSGNWVITAWNFIPADAAGEQYFILLTNYNASNSDWALQLKFDNTAGQMSIEEGTGVADIIRDQWIEVKVEIQLGANTQSIYYNDTFIETIPWAPSSGILEFDALDLFSDGGSSVYWDDILLTEQLALTPATWASIKHSLK